MIFRWLKNLFFGPFGLFVGKRWVVQVYQVDPSTGKAAHWAGVQTNFPGHWNYEDAIREAQRETRMSRVAFVERFVRRNFLN